MGSKGEPQQAAPPDVAYYYPEPFWRASQGEWLKSVLLFFDEIAILLPRYMAGREALEDPVLAGPLKQRGLLRVLEPETFIDRETVEALSNILLDLMARGAFDQLPKTDYFAELSRSRLGWDADVGLAKTVIKELRRRKLAKPSKDKVSVPLHPSVRTIVLVLLSQLARSAGKRQGLDLHPLTADRDALDGLVRTLSLPNMPTFGHIVALDLETVSLNLATVPLDEVLSFRKQHGAEYRSYARSVRRLIAEVSPLEAGDRERIMRDRREELADKAHELRKIAGRAWRRPLAGLGLGALGAAWTASRGDVLGGALALGLAAAIATVPKANAGAYSYLFSAEDSLSEPGRGHYWSLPF
jgi:hypothetical protein